MRLHKCASTAVADSAHDITQQFDQVVILECGSGPAQLCEPNPAITKLMSHADSKTTEIYLKGGAKALRDTDYVPVEAPLTLAEMRE